MAAIWTRQSGNLHMVVEGRIGLHGGRLVGWMLFEKFFLENDNRDHTDRYGSIGNIEYGTEELKFVPAYKWNPSRVMGSDQGEIKHVHDSTMQKARIPLGGK